MSLDDFGVPDDKRFNIKTADGAIETADQIGLRLQIADGSFIQIEGGDGQMQSIIQALSSIIQRRRLEHESRTGHSEVAAQPVHKVRILPSPDGQPILQIAGKDQVLLSFALPRGAAELIVQHLMTALRMRH